MKFNFFVFDDGPGNRGAPAVASPKPSFRTIDGARTEPAVALLLDVYDLDASSAGSLLRFVLDAKPLTLDCLRADIADGQDGAKGAARVQLMWLSRQVAAARLVRDASERAEKVAGCVDSDELGMDAMMEHCGLLGDLVTLSQGDLYLAEARALYGRCRDELEPIFRVQMDSVGSEFGPTLRRAAYYRHAHALLTGRSPWCAILST